MTGPAPPPKHSKDLANAVYDDWKRKVVDEAKKRAVGQNVDYDTFKNMVSVAHLRPIGAPRTVTDDVMLPSWKYTADGAARSNEAQALADAAAALLSKEPSEAPSTSGDFYREWRRNCPSSDAKYRYLRLVGPAGVEQLFRVEIGVDVLKEALTVLEASWMVHAGAAEDGAVGDGHGAALSEAMFVLSLLRSLSQAGRFGLTLKLMGSGVRAVIESLFGQLQGAVEAAGAASAQHSDGGEAMQIMSNDEFTQLRATYGLK